MLTSSLITHQPALTTTPVNQSVYLTIPKAGVACGTTSRHKTSAVVEIRKLLFSQVHSKTPSTFTDLVLHQGLEPLQQYPTQLTRKPNPKFDYSKKQAALKRPRAFAAHSIHLVIIAICFRYFINTVFAQSSGHWKNLKRCIEYGVQVYP